MSEEQLEVPQDELTEVIMDLMEDQKYKRFLELIEYHYVYMACHVPGDPYTTAFREGQREMAAMICGINKRVIEWQKAQTATV